MIISVKFHVIVNSESEISVCSFHGNFRSKSNYNYLYYIFNVNVNRKIRKIKGT